MYSKLGGESCRLVWHNLLRNVEKSLHFDCSGQVGGSGLIRWNKPVLGVWEKYEKPSPGLLSVLSRKEERRISIRDVLQLYDSQTTDGHWNLFVLNSDHLGQLHQDLILGQH